MISPEFKSTISDKNLLLARIMLKDSLVIDPTFEQFDEMLSYAKKKLPNIMVAFNSEPLENDHTKWDLDQMNMELVQLVNNFSDDRVNHLKRVISTVRSDEIKKIRAKRAIQNTCCYSTTMKPAYNDASSPTMPPESKSMTKQEALNQMFNEGIKIVKVIKEVHENRKKWSLTNVKDMECAARQILEATKSYKENR